MDHIDTVVIGAGVVGLAAARALALAGREVVILERERLIGSGVSSRNSEVIHAGIYYPKDSLKASAALLSPSTGVIDSHGFMLSLLGEAEDHGAMLAYGAQVVGGAVEDDGVALAVGEAGERSGTEPNLKARLLVNAAGLDATAVARRIAGFPAEHAPVTRLAKGSYFALAGRAPFSRLIYPVPEPGGLGVHLTLDLAGQARFGPDVEWIETEDYDVEPARGDKFYAAVRAYWPGLADGALTPAYSGIRPKLTGPGEPAADFVIAGPETHGVPGVINLFGIESPGLTSSLAIADEVVRISAEMG